MMFRFAMALVAVCLFADAGHAQIFPNAPWNKANSRFSSSDGGCPGGVCPVPGRGVLRPDVNINVNAAPSLVEEHNAQHNGYYGGPQWTWPGDLEKHMRESHGAVQTYSQSSYASAAPPVIVVKSGGSSGSVSYGSSGGGMFRVGGRDTDGAYISSIGSTISPSIAAQASAQGIQPLAIGDRMAFRRSLLEAARNARKSGEITAAQFFMLSAASRNPNVLDKMQQAVHEAAIEDGLATAQAIDWNGLIDFIEKLIPIIIQLIDLFS